MDPRSIRVRTALIAVVLAGSLWAQPQASQPTHPKSSLPDKIPEPLSGPPIVSAKAWAIADAKTGKVLWSHKQDVRLPMASTTKLMTALLVARMAGKDPKVLDESVTFSPFADATGGSSAAVRAGECLPVRELLYGLLLPSGNDAANALAEHFGGRFQKPPKTMVWPVATRPRQKPKAWFRFVAEMNRTARALGMKDTRYWNPHGLDCKGHRSTARDLLILARLVVESPLLSEYVATRRHRATLLSPNGRKRQVTWRNTNRLLRIESYEGLKTGTTSGAGACLVSSSRRAEDHLLMVVLGASSSTGRYVDSRNLYRWSFRELGHRD
ncbi:MAG: D-alanyl-D-alanine carboxypeptidase family protein [Planctomycetota bacterium]|jgi:D-alanyl-D-alanine carboxypeptidase (penicillin-binding protein 5/6)